MILLVNDCCGVVTLETGTYIIHFLHWVSAIFGFVPWVSTGVNVARDYNHRYEQGEPHPPYLVTMYVMIGIGGLSSLLRLLMATMLKWGLQREESRYIRWYIAVTLLVLALTLAVIVLSVLLTDIFLAIMSVGALGMEMYFLLVIFSTYRNMKLQEEKARTASQLRDSQLQEGQLQVGQLQEGQLQVGQLPQV